MSLDLAHLVWQSFQEESSNHSFLLNLLLRLTKHLKLPVYFNLHFKNKKVKSSKSGNIKKKKKYIYPSIFFLGYVSINKASMKLLDQAGLPGIKTLHIHHYISLYKEEITFFVLYKIKHILHRTNDTNLFSTIKSVQCNNIMGNWKIDLWQGLHRNEQQRPP